jgi:hypothetical protein
MAPPLLTREGKPMGMRGVGSKFFATPATVSKEGAPTPPVPVTTEAREKARAKARAARQARKRQRRGG